MISYGLVLGLGLRLETLIPVNRPFKATESRHNIESKSEKYFNSSWIGP